ncbi:MAG: hypothetical protein AAGA67_05480 [Cyanobacteria bacterium P01_F01_bin.153]
MTQTAERPKIQVAEKPTVKVSGTKQLLGTSRVAQRHQMQKYVLISVGCCLLFFASFPLAYWRVSQSDRYGVGPLNSASPDQSSRMPLEED